jgi:cytochrome c553
MTGNKNGVTPADGSGESRGHFLDLSVLVEGMMKRVRPGAAGVLVNVLSLAVFAAMPGRADAGGDVKAGREKAQKCEVCHGLNGVSKVVEAPNIAGQNQQYLVKQLNAFRSGERQNEMMSIIARTLSRDDIEDLAAYYAEIEITVGKIPDQ